MFRHNATKEELESGKWITFDEFVRYIIHEKNSSGNLNRHWETYDKICSPCSIPYKKIGFLETMDEDLDMVMHYAYGSAFQTPRLKRNSKSDKYEERVYMQLDSKTKSDLLNIYKTDFMFRVSCP